MDLQSKNRAFTLVELLTVMAIITMLIGLLIPSLNTVRRFAKNTKQSAQLASIGAALTTFRNEYGEYPPSEGRSLGGSDAGARNFCGAQKLCEAMLGQDLMGFHPESEWSVTRPFYYYTPVTLGQRVGRYLELATANAFRLGISASGAQDGLFDLGAPALSGIDLAPDTFVLCDVFANTRIVMANGDTVRAGKPILYYRANASSRVLDGGARPQDRIYNPMDNIDLIAVQDISDDGNPGDHPLSLGAGAQFYPYVTDPRVSTEDWDWPYRPDSYLLITAGADGLYGSGDDICNFGN